MNSIDEFPFFDKLENSESKTKQKINLDKLTKNINNIKIFSFGKEDNINSYLTTNDKTIKDSPKQKITQNQKEVSPFTLYDNRKPLNRKLNFCDEDEPMNIEIQDNNSSISDDSMEGKNDDKMNTKSEDEFEEEENEFKCIRRQSKNDLSFAKPKFDEDYIIIKTLCKGEMGTVYLCMK